MMHQRERDSKGHRGWRFFYCFLLLTASEIRKIIPLIKFHERDFLFFEFSCIWNWNSCRCAKAKNIITITMVFVEIKILFWKKCHTFYYFTMCLYALWTLDLRIIVTHVFWNSRYSRHVWSLSLASLFVSLYIKKFTALHKCCAILCVCVWYHTWKIITI